MRLPIALSLVRKEHDAELARHGIKRLIRKGQGQSIGLPPRDPIIARHAAQCGRPDHRTMHETGDAGGTLLLDQQLKRAGMAAHEHLAVRAAARGFRMPVIGAFPWAGAEGHSTNPAIRLSSPLCKFLLKLDGAQLSSSTT
jgi:hypothetical protein